jgi:hypothetical protein
MCIITATELRQAAMSTQFDQSGYWDIQVRLGAVLIASLGGFSNYFTETFDRA